MTDTKIDAVTSLPRSLPDAMDDFEAEHKRAIAGLGVPASDWRTLRAKYTGSLSIEHQRFRGGDVAPERIVLVRRGDPDVAIILDNEESVRLRRFLDED